MAESIPEIKQEFRQKLMGRFLNRTLRFKILKRDNFRCQYCGRKAPNVELEVDHIVPKVKGGTNSSNNLITSCVDCNRGKGRSQLEVIPLKELTEEEKFENKKRAAEIIDSLLEGYHKNRNNIRN